jgi:hypothetical protein
MDAASLDEQVGSSSIAVPFQGWSSINHMPFREEQARDPKTLAQNGKLTACRRAIEQANRYVLAVMPTLPGYRFTEVPDAKQASSVALAVRRCWGVSEGEPIDVGAQLLAFGWTVHLNNLEAPIGGLQAVMAPSMHGFVFIADTRPGPADRSCAECGEATKDRVNYRLAHELGHVFFYDQATPPRRLARHCDDEEAFCDAFAAALLKAA